jgi:hypothetical protein
MLRTVLLIVALLIILAIGAVAVGLVDVTQGRRAQTPTVDVKVNDVKIGTTTKQIELPAVTIDKGGEPAAQPATTPPTPPTVPGNTQQ